MKMYVLDFGEIAMVNGNPVTADARETPRIPIHGFLFETEIGYVLYDTGCDAEGMSATWPEAMRLNPYLPGGDGTVEAQLRKLGLTPADVGTVVASHLHLDHAGALDKFPHAKIYVDKREFQQTLHHYADGDFSGFHLKSDIEHWLRAELDWQFVTPSPSPVPLCKHLSILAFGPGHSYGMLGLLAELENGERYLLAGDTLYTREHLDDPNLMAGIVYDAPGYLRTRQRIRHWSEAYGAQVLFGHDRRQFASLIKAGRGCYGAARRP